MYILISYQKETLNTETVNPYVVNDVNCVLLVNDTYVKIASRRVLSLQLEEVIRLVCLSGDCKRSDDYK